jgi:hypothetical protein
LLMSDEWVDFDSVCWMSWYKYTMLGFWFCLSVSIWNLDYVICVDFDNLSWFWNCYLTIW